jgi:predicted phage terminase large subunit-like protein
LGKDLQAFLNEMKDTPLDKSFALASQLAEEGKVDAAKQVVKAACFWDKVCFACVCLSHHVPDTFGKHHKEMLDRLIPGQRGIKRVDMAPRGHAKTTSRITIEVLWDICFARWCELLGFLPDVYIGIISETTDLSEAHIDTIKAELEDNPVIRALFGSLTGSPWGMTLFRTSNGVWVERFGRRSQIRGKKRGKDRLTKIVLDDVENLETVRSPTRRRQIADWMARDVAPAGLRGGKTNLVCVGTSLHPDALLVNLVKNPGFDSTIYRACLSESHRPDLWEDWKRIYCDLTLGDTDRRESAQTFFDDNEVEMMDGVEMLWDAGFSYYEYQVAKIEQGSVAVNMEYQNLPYDESQFIFPMKKAVYFEVTDEGLLRFTKEGEETVHRRNYDRRVDWSKIDGITLFLDWAGGKDSIDNAYACITALAWEKVRFSSEKYRYVIDSWMERKPLSGQVRAVFELEQKWNQFPVRFAIEEFPKDITGANHDRVRQLFRECQAEYQSELALNFLPRRANKIERITGIEPLIANGWLAFNASLPQNYIDQFIQFPTHEHLDAPDSAEGALHFPPSRERPERFLAYEHPTRQQVTLTR